MNKLFFYEVDTNYTDYIRSFGDPRTPYISYLDHHRFLCGILFENSGMNYFAPISSFIHPQKSNIIIKDITGKPIGSIRFSFMFPVPISLVHVKDFSKEEESYRRLLDKEYFFCLKNADRIIEKAKHIYQSVKTKNDPILVKHCCDFDVLEKAYRSYCITYNI